MGVIGFIRGYRELKRIIGRNSGCGVLEKWRLWVIRFIKGIWKGERFVDFE